MEHLRETLRKIGFTPEGVEHMMKLVEEAVARKEVLAAEETKPGQ